MRGSRVGLLPKRAACIGVWACFATVAAAQPSQRHLQFDIGVGQESQTSPVFQISPEGNILYLNGSQGLYGGHVRGSLQGSASWDWGAGVSTAVSADATLKRSPQTPDFNLSSVNLQPSIRIPLGQASVGLGLNLQSYDAADRHFRDSTGVQLDWTRATPQGLWGVVAEVARYKHPADLSDMDATASSLVLLRQYTNPLPEIDGIDFSFIVGQEINDHGFRDLSNHSAMLQANVRWNWLDADWSLGQSWRLARFEESTFPGEPARSDDTVSTDLAAQWPLSAKKSLRVEINQARNISNTRLYDNNMLQWSVTLRREW